LALFHPDGLWILPRGGEPQRFIKSPDFGGYPEFSPDGRWIAYVGDQARQSEVYLSPYPGPGRRVRVSTDGGTAPAWSPDGRELFYRGPDDDEGRRSMYVVDVNGGPSLTVGIPRVLFRSKHGTLAGIRAYDVSPDGQRFLMIELGPLTWAQPVKEFHLILNWFEELKRLVPAD
jgi:Tol biopolymer transport system component